MLRVIPFLLSLLGAAAVVAAPCGPVWAQGPGAGGATDKEKERTALRLFDRAKRAFRAGRKAEALEHLIEAHKLFAHPFIEYYLARTYRAVGESARACAYWSRVLGRIPNKEAEIQVELALCDLGRGDPDASLRRLDALGRRLPRSLGTRYAVVRADALAALGRVTEAEVTLAPVLSRKLSPEDQAEATRVLRVVEALKYGYPLDTAERREAASLIDNAQSRRRERRFEAAVRSLHASLAREDHPKTRAVRNQVLREWLADLRTKPSNLRAEGLLGLAEALEGRPLPPDLARATAHLLVVAAREQIRQRKRRSAAVLARAALVYTDDTTAREVLVQAVSTQDRIFIPGATFRMGTPHSDVGALVAACEREVSDAERCSVEHYEAESDARRVRVDGFYIGRHEITVAQFAACVERGDCTREHFDVVAPCPFRLRDGGRLPMACVDWVGARQYCGSVGGRLPTEAEWELAAAGVQGRVWPWGSSRPNGKRANLADRTAGEEGTAYPYDPRLDDGHPRTSATGRFEEGATPSGVQDMAGNVAEWCLDWFQGPVVAPSGDADAIARNPRGPCAARPDCPGLNLRAVRGGSYASLTLEVRSRARVGIRPGEVFPWLGFRCIWTESH